jgi:hypothetical protein
MEEKVHGSYAEVPNSMDLTPGFTHALRSWRNTQLQKQDHASNCQREFKLSRYSYDRRVLHNKRNGWEREMRGVKFLKRGQWANIYVPCVVDFRF